MIWKKLPLCNLQAKLKVQPMRRDSIPASQTHRFIQQFGVLYYWTIRICDVFTSDVSLRSEGCKNCGLSGFWSLFFSWIAANSKAVHLYHQQPITKHFAGTSSTNFRPLGTRAEYQYYTTCMPTPTGKSGLLSSHQVRNQGYTGMVGKCWKTLRRYQGSS